MAPRSRLAGANAARRAFADTLTGDSAHVDSIRKLRWVRQLAKTTMPTRRSAPGKNLLFVRHGESEYNLHRQKHGMSDPFIVDPKLTTTGEAQARAAQSRLSAELAALGESNPFVVSSPLSRALATALIARPEAAGRIEVWPELREVIFSSGDLGTPASVLRASKLARAASGSSASLRALEEIWWTRPRKRRRDDADADDDALAAYRADPSGFVSADERGLPARVESIVQKLAAVEASTIIVVAHSDLLLALTRRLGLEDPKDDDPRGWWLLNGEVRLAAGVRLI